MSITFSMCREGQFTAKFSTQGNQCGSGGQQIYSYVCEIEVGEKLDSRGFILDNYAVQGYFDREYSLKSPDAGPAQSCERIAQLATEHFAKILTREGRAPKRVSVTIKGSAFAGLTATWEASDAPRGIDIDMNLAAVDEASSLGEADVWHAGSRSFYRAKLLKKHTLNEAMFDPTDDQNIDYDAAAEERALARVKADPANTLFGRSLSEVQAALNAYDERHTKPVEEIVCDYTYTSPLTVAWPCGFLSSIHEYKAGSPLCR